MRGLADVLKRRAVFDFYRKRSDIVILQETHSTKQVESQWRMEWGGRIFFSHGENNSRGVCICIKKDCSLTIDNVYSDTEGRLIILDIHENDRVYTCAAVYAPK